MKKYRYVTLGLDDITPKYYTLTEKEILEKHMPVWSRQMREFGAEDKINEADCIADWVRDHCAWEIND